MQEQIGRYELDLDHRSREKVQMEKDLEDMRDQVKGAAQWEEKLLEIVNQWAHCYLFIYVVNIFVKFCHILYCEVMLEYSTVSPGNYQIVM